MDRFVVAYKFQIHYRFRAIPYWQFELTHSTQLQSLYNEGELNLDKSNITSNVDKYYQNLSKENLSKENLTNYD